MIVEALRGKTILVTGTTGFLGKSIVEKCLRSIPEVGRINLAIRSSARRPAADRLEREILSSPAFRRLKEQLGDEYTAIHDGAMTEPLEQALRQGNVFGEARRP